jgi:hypothetical protein
MVQYSPLNGGKHHRTDFTRQRHNDCEDTIGFLRASVIYGLECEDTGEAFRAALSSIIDLHSGKTTWSSSDGKNSDPK